MIRTKSSSSVAAASASSVLMCYAAEESWGCKSCFFLSSAIILKQSLRFYSANFAHVHVLSAIFQSRRRGVDALHIVSQNGFQGAGCPHRVAAICTACNTAGSESCLLGISPSESISWQGLISIPAGAQIMGKHYTK